MSGGPPKIGRIAGTPAAGQSYGWSRKSIMWLVIPAGASIRAMFGLHRLGPRSARTMRGEKMMSNEASGKDAVSISQGDS